MTSEQYDPDVEPDEVDDGLADAIDEDSPLKDLEFLQKRVARLVELRMEKDETKLAADNAKKAFDEYQAEFFEEYEKSPLQGSIKVQVTVRGEDHTVQLVPRSTKYGRILDYDKAVEYFKKRNKDKEYIKDDFRMGRIHELVREHMEQKKPLPDGLDYYSKEFFTMTIK